MLLKAFHIPIFGGIVLIVADKTIDKALKDIGITDCDSDGARAMFCPRTNGDLGYIYTLAFRLKPSIEDIVHEVNHLKNKLYEYHGVQHDFENDELESYLIDWLTTEVRTAFKKV